MSSENVIFHFYWYFWNNNEDVKRNEKSLTNEKLSFPVIPPISNRDRKTNVTLGFDKRLDTNSSIPIDDGTYDVLRVEAALYFITLFEARTRYINNCSSEHISTFRCKNEWQVSPSCKRNLQ